MIQQSCGGVKYKKFDIDVFPKYDQICSGPGCIYIKRVWISQKNIKEIYQLLIIEAN
jgi:hypothetical protein